MMFKIRQRSCLLATTALVLVPFFIVIMVINPMPSNEQLLTQRLAESHMRIQYLESLIRARREDVHLLAQYLGQLQSNITFLATRTNYDAANISNMNFAPLANLIDSLSAEGRELLKNASHQHTPMYKLAASASASARLPNAYNFLPHLLDDQSSLRPSYLRTKGRSDVSIVLGVPTVKREKQSYLLGTLQNLIDNMNEEEQNQTLIIVYIGESDYDTVQNIAKQVETTFESYIDGGLLEIVAPSPTYYPNFDALRITLNDPLERVKWRSKQNLDFAYLMAYAQSKGTFYVQLEDDILTKPQFITTMKQFAIAKSAIIRPDQPSWFILDFCQLGFIGKMFKSAELPYLITFFEMFYNDKPVDWLLSYFIETKICRTDKNHKHCALEKAKFWIHYRKSLFQHIGMSSSLKGKVQKLKDKQFGGKVPTFYPHEHNPPATTKTNIVPYKNYLLKRAYAGETYFWGLLPQPGDLVQFIFEKPTVLRRYLFRSGNSEHPSDRFYNTTIEVLPAEAHFNNASIWNSYNFTSDGFLIVGTFDAMGMAESLLDTRIGALNEIRLHVHSDSENWALLSEIDLQMENTV